jgi:hypothetical protein
MRVFEALFRLTWFRQLVRDANSSPQAAVRVLAADAELRSAVRAAAAAEGYSVNDV